jgi:uncharacterized glyoxalase superfamily protein PhnB
VFTHRKDIEKSLAWYRDIVGFVVDQPYERDGKLRGVALKAGAVRILLNVDDGGRGWDRVKGEGFSLQFTTSQRVDDVADRIKKHGGTLESEPADMPWGARVFRVNDPDGYKLLISSPRRDPVIAQLRPSFTPTVSRRPHACRSG